MPVRVLGTLCFGCKLENGEKAEATFIIASDQNQLLLSPFVKPVKTPELVFTNLQNGVTFSASTAQKVVFV